VKLPKAATAGMSFIDYGSRKYRLLVPLQDNKVHNFQIDGSATKGWKFPSMSNNINKAVQYFRMGNKDVLVISDSVGNVIYALLFD